MFNAASAAASAAESFPHVQTLKLASPAVLSGVAELAQLLIVGARYGPAAYAGPAPTSTPPKYVSTADSIISDPRGLNARRRLTSSSDSRADIRRETGSFVSLLLHDSGKHDPVSAMEHEGCFLSGDAARLPAGRHELSAPEVSR